MRGKRVLLHDEEDALFQFYQMADESKKTKQGIRTMMVTFGMWGRIRYEPLTEAVKKWEGHNEQQNVLDSIVEVLGRAPPNRSAVKRLEESLAFALTFVGRARRIMEPEERIRKACELLFLSHSEYLRTRRDKCPIRQMVLDIPNSPVDNIRATIEELWDSGRKTIVVQETTTEVTLFKVMYLPQHMIYQQKYMLIIFLD